MLFLPLFIKCLCKGREDAYVPCGEMQTMHILGVWDDRPWIPTSTFAWHLETKESHSEFLHHYVFMSCKAIHLVHQPGRRYTWIILEISPVIQQDFDLNNMQKSWLHRFSFHTPDLTISVFGSEQESFATLGGNSQTVPKCISIPCLLGSSGHDLLQACSGRWYPCLGFGCHDFSV